MGTLWGYVGDHDIAAYLFASTAKKCAQREGEMGPEDMLNLRTGITVADASNLFGNPDASGICARTIPE